MSSKICSLVDMRQISGELALREKCSYSEFFWSAFSHIRTDYGEMQSISPYSVWRRENKYQENSKYRHFSPIVVYWEI